MDPNANHARQVELALQIRKLLDVGDDVAVIDIADELAGLVIALNDWIANGGKFARDLLPRR